MSEYQYYEFAAIDLPLDREQMDELRAVSTRAEISSSGFVNHYEWGDLKADTTDLMRRYFDVFVYTANWCNCRLALRVPLAAFSQAQLEPFTTSYVLLVDESQDHWVIDWALEESEDYERFSMDDGRSWMRRLMPLRDELLRGDMRALYLGWLSGLAAGEIEDDELEPEVPPGLATLSLPQQALAEFLEVDPDMLVAAASGGAKMLPASTEAEEARLLNTWLDQWPREEMTALLGLMLSGQSQAADRQLRARHAAWLKTQHPLPAAGAALRSVGELRQLAEAAAVVRLQREAKKQARQQAKEREQHEKRLRQLMADIDKHWAAADREAQRGTASGYDAAARALVEMAGAYALTSGPDAFDPALQHWLVPHTKRGALMRRLREAGLLAAKNQVFKPFRAVAQV